MKGVKMTEIFRSTGKCRTFEAFLPCRLRPPSQVEALAGSTAQKAANEDDPGFYPLWVIYGGHCPGGYVLARVFPGSVHPRSATSRLGSYRRPSEQVRAR